VGAVGHAGVGHDGGGVGIDEDDGVALFAEGFAGLRAAVVEFTRLADDNRAGADEEDFLEVGTFWHGGSSGGGRQWPSRADHCSYRLAYILSDEAGSPRGDGMPAPRAAGRPAHVLRERK